MCFLYTPNRRLSHFSAVLSASLSRALTTVLLCLLPSCLPAMKRGRDNAGVEEISPRFYPRHRFRGIDRLRVSPVHASSCLVISMEGRILFFLFPLAANRIFFRHLWINTRIKISRNHRPRENEFAIFEFRDGYFSLSARISVD